MPPSAERDEEQPIESQVGLAILAEALYLANLLAIPGVGFLILVALYRRRGKDSPPLATAHLGQTFYASLWAGVLLVIVNALILLLGGYQGVHTWVVLIIYFTVCHSTLVLFGVFGLAKAMAGQCWRFPLIGPRLPEGCAR
jgi:4-hydroxybenzoate polyprenyltransferase